MVSAITSPRAAHAVRATVALDLSRPDRYMYDNPYAPEGMGREYINEPNVRRPLADYVGASEASAHHGLPIHAPALM